MIDITLEKLLTTGYCVSFADRGYLPQSPGLYFVICRDDPPRFAYIGKTQNFQIRWQNHHREAEIEVLEKYGSQVDIFYMVNRSADPMLSEMERYLIRQFKPFLNDTTSLDRKKKKRVQKEKRCELEAFPGKKQRGRKKGSPNKKPASGYIHPRKDSEHWVYQYWDIEQRKKRSLSVHPDDVEQIKQAIDNKKPVDEIIRIIKGRRKKN